MSGNPNGHGNPIPSSLCVRGAQRVRSAGSGQRVTANARRNAARRHAPDRPTELDRWSSSRSKHSTKKNAQKKKRKQTKEREQNQNTQRETHTHHSNELRIPRIPHPKTHTRLALPKRDLHDLPRFDIIRQGRGAEGYYQDFIRRRAVRADDGEREVGALLRGVLECPGVR